MATSNQASPVDFLGYTRRRMFSCLGGDMPCLPQYRELPSGEDAIEAFQALVEWMIERCQSDTDPLTRALIGAARLLIGDVGGADEVLDHLPVTPVKLDHGAGYCLVVPTQALQTALPVPAALRDVRLIEGSSEQAALRAWLHAHRSRLVWERRQGRYALSTMDSPET